jgi:hypothetical protein
MCEADKVELQEIKNILNSCRKADFVRMTRRLHPDQNTDCNELATQKFSALENYYSRCKKDIPELDEMGRPRFVIDENGERVYLKREVPTTLAERGNIALDHTDDGYIAGIKEALKNRALGAAGVPEQKQDRDISAEKRAELRARARAEVAAASKAKLEANRRAAEAEARSAQASAQAAKAREKAAEAEAKAAEARAAEQKSREEAESKAIEQSNIFFNELGSKGIPVDIWLDPHKHGNLIVNEFRNVLEMLKADRQNNSLLEKNIQQMANIIRNHTSVFESLQNAPLKTDIRYQNGHGMLGALIPILNSFMNEAMNLLKENKSTNKARIASEQRQQEVDELANEIDESLRQAFEEKVRAIAAREAAREAARAAAEAAEAEARAAAEAAEAEERAAAEAAEAAERAAEAARLAAEEKARVQAKARARVEAAEARAAAAAAKAETLDSAAEFIYISEMMRQKELDTLIQAKMVERGGYVEKLKLQTQAWIAKREAEEAEERAQAEAEAAKKRAEAARLAAEKRARDEAEERERIRVQAEAARARAQAAERAAENEAREAEAAREAERRRWSQNYGMNFNSFGASEKEAQRESERRRRQNYGMFGGAKDLHIDPTYMYRK